MTPTHSLEMTMSLSPWTSFPLDALWSKVYPLGREKHWKRGEVIFHAGSVQNHVYLIRGGIAKLESLNADGKTRILCLYAGESLVGLYSLFWETPNIHTLSALTDCSAVVYHRHVLIHDIIPAHPDIVLSLLRCLTSKNLRMSMQLQNLTFLPAQARIALLLYQLHEASLNPRNAGSDPLGISQQVMAEVLGLHRSTLSTCIAELREQGILGEKIRPLEVRAPDRLLEMVAAGTTG